MHQLRIKVMIQRIAFMRNQSVYWLSSTKNNMKILLGDFNAKIGREDIFKRTIGNESSLESNNDNGVRVVNFGTSKNLIVKSTMFPHLNFVNTLGKMLLD
jgi:hypothetical protein